MYYIYLGQCVRLYFIIMIGLVRSPERRIKLWKVFRLFHCVFISISALDAAMSYNKYKFKDKVQFFKKKKRSYNKIKMKYCNKIKIQIHFMLYCHVFGSYINLEGWYKAFWNWFKEKEMKKKMRGDCGFAYGKDDRKIVPNIRRSQVKHRLFIANSTKSRTHSRIYT